MLKISNGLIKNTFFANECCIRRGSKSRMIMLLIKRYNLPKNIKEKFLTDLDTDLKVMHRNMCNDLNFQHAIQPGLIDVQTMYYESKCMKSSQATKYDLGMIILFYITAGNRHKNETK